MKNITTLIDDMHDTLEGKGGWDEATSKFLGDWVAKKAGEKFTEPQEERNHLGLSAVGRPCNLQKWSLVNDSTSQQPITGETYGNFFWGDLIEAFTISLAMAAGHRVEGLQEPLNVFGIPGSGDCIIDGHVVDVKSASSYSFTKFKYNQLKGYYKYNKRDDTRKWINPSEVDGFGYISQLSSYLEGYKDDPRVHDKENASFLAVNKNKFQLHLDTYNFVDELKGKQAEIEDALAVVNGPKPPRGFSPVPDGKSGNMKLGFQCSYCGWNHKCFPNQRKFAYSDGVRSLTTVAREPAESIKEIK